MSETMPNEHAAAGAPAHPAAASVFSAADWAAFQAEDFAAGKAVVLLMLGIFSMGVALYSTVAYFIMF
jgi:hypothetical protein